MTMIIPMRETNEYRSMMLVENLDDIEEAKKIFDEYIGQGIVVSGTYESDKWKCTNELQTYTFRFTLTKEEYTRGDEYFETDYETFMFRLKNYIIYNLKTSTLLYMSHTCIQIQCIVRHILSSIRQGLAKKEAISSYRKYSKKNLRMQINFFLMATSGELIDELCQYMDGIIQVECKEAKKKTNHRNLASIHSYALFHDILRDFWKTAKAEEKKLYFPLYLWWHISMVIPLRPTEMVLIPNECISTKDGHYYIIVRRTRLKSEKECLVAHKIDKDYSMYTYEITKDLFEEISEYKEMVKDEVSTIDTLFRSKTKNVFLRQDLTELLRKFERNIIVNRYRCKVVGKGMASEDHFDEIEKIDLGDTRHLAEISLFLQGNSVVACQLLAGHIDVYSSNHYYTNLCEIGKSLVISEKILRNRDVQTRPTLSEVKRFGVSTEKATPVDGGWCFSEQVKNKDYSPCMRIYSNRSKTFFDCGDCIYFKAKTGEYMSVIEKSEKELEYATAFMEYIIEQYKQEKAGMRQLIYAHTKVQTAFTQYKKAQEGTYGK